MDLKIETEEIKLKVRANGVIMHEDKVLMCMINKSGFWCCPGGHIHLGEDSKTASLREIREEVGIEFDDSELFLMMESFFIGKNDKQFHELSFYYLMKGEIPADKLNDYSYEEDDEGKMVHLDFKWIKISDIHKFDVRPKALHESLVNKDFSLKHIVSLGK